MNTMNTAESNTPKVKVNIPEDILGKAFEGRPWTQGSPYELRVSEIPEGQIEQLKDDLRSGKLEALKPYVIGYSDMRDEGCDVLVRELESEEEAIEVGNQIAGHLN